MNHRDTEGRAGPPGPPPPCGASPASNQLRTRRNLPHGVPPWAGPEAILFITVCCTPRGLNQLCREETAAIIWESIAYRQKRGDWFVRLWLLMPDHLHALVSFPTKVDYPKILAGWKEIIAKRTSVRWQRDFFDHRLRSHESHEEKAAYIRLNPVRKGLVRDASDWKFVWAPN